MTFSTAFITHFSSLPSRSRPNHSTSVHKRPRNPTIRLCNDPPNPRPPTTTPSGKENTTPTSSNPLSSSASNGTPPQTSGLSSSAAPQLAPSPPKPHPSPPASQIRLALGPFSTSIPARWLLYAVPFCWGSFGPAVRLLYSSPHHPDVSVFNSERLLLSTLFYIPVFVAELNFFRNRNPPEPQTQTQKEKPKHSFAFVRAGFELGIYVFLANVAQVLGLQQTSASRAAFLVQLQTVIVPVMAGLFGLDIISRRTWFSSVVAVAGVALLSSDKGHGTVSSFTGDSLEVLSAVFFSTYIIRLSKYANDLPANPLVATKIAVQFFLSLGWAFFSEIDLVRHHIPTDVPIEAVSWSMYDIMVTVGVVFWTGFFSSAAAGWAQTQGQKGVPASEAVVIFATQPLWASALAAIILGESFGAKGFVGGAMIVAATLIANGGGSEEAKKES